MLPDVTLVLSERGKKLLDGDPCMSKNSTERAFRYLSMIRNGNSSVRSGELPQDDVTTTLSVNFIAESLKCSDKPGAQRRRAVCSSSNLDDLFTDWWRNRLVTFFETLDVE